MFKNSIKIRHFYKDGKTYCYIYKDKESGLYGRSANDGLWVQSYDPDYVAIGAKKYKSKINEGK